MHAAGALVFARCLGFVFRAPGFSHPAVPAPLRAGFAYVLSLALATPFATRRVPVEELTVGCAIEFALGAAIGTAASMLYDGAYSGGRLLDDYVGIHASVPSANVAAGAGFGRLWSLAFTAAFFAFGGDGVALRGLAETLRSLPPGSLVHSHELAAFAVTLPATLLRAALLIAGPGLAFALVVQISLAAVSRVVPRLATFTLAFPLVFAAVLIATLAAFGVVLRAAATPWWDLSALHA